MVNQDTKLGVGALAFAGSLLAAYVFYKHWKKRKEDEETNRDSVGSGLTDVRRRQGTRGRNGRNGRHVSDPGRMFYSTDRVMPVPSDTAKEGIYKRHSSGARISQIPKPVSPGGGDAKKEFDYSVRAGSEPDVIPASERLSEKPPTDERYEDAVKRKRVKKKPDASPTRPSAISTQEQSKIPKIKTPAKEPVQQPTVASTVKSEQSQLSTPPSSPGSQTPTTPTPTPTPTSPDTEPPSMPTPTSQEPKPPSAPPPIQPPVPKVAQTTVPKSGEGPSDEAGAGEAMAAPFDPHLLEDQSTMMIGDSEGSDIGAGDTLAEEDQFVSKAGINLSPSSSEASSPARSPLKTADTSKQGSESQNANSEPESSAKSEPECPKSEHQSQEADTSEVPTAETKLDPETITKAIMQVQKSPSTVDKKLIAVLVKLLKVDEEKLLQTALDSIVRCAAFSANQRVLRDCGCPEELCRLLKAQGEAALAGRAYSDSLLVSVNNAVMNLSMDVANQAKLQTCIPILIDLVSHEGLSSNVKLSSLQPLTNLSTTSAYHGQYTRAVQQLYHLLDTANRVIRIQALKLLVNLSCNSDMVKHLLAAKAPSCILSLLEMTSDPHLSLRLVTLLANIASTVQKEEVTYASLPPDDKAASPETMYSAIYSIHNLTQLRSKVYPLTRHDSEDISQQAARLYNSLPNC